jgi:hypothetical protein
MSFKKKRGRQAENISLLAMNEEERNVQKKKEYPEKEKRHHNTGKK